MILLYAGCLGLAVAIFISLMIFAPQVSMGMRILISLSIALVLAIAATLWVYYAAHQLPPDATIITPIPELRLDSKTNNN
jgi:hypothetical protein